MPTQGTVTLYARNEVLSATHETLAHAHIACGPQVGISESRLRKWLLSISAFLRNGNGSLMDAIALWRSNAEREFDGAEECLICYAVVHPQTGALPRLKCRTCEKFFHGACLYRWFRSAGKSTCPHCQSAW